MQQIKMEEITQWEPSWLFTFTKHVKLMKSRRMKWLGYVA
jgi:hypothetical protein